MIGRCYGDGLYIKSLRDVISVTILNQHKENAFDPDVKIAYVYLESCGEVPTTAESAELLIVALKRFRANERKRRTKKR